MRRMHCALVSTNPEKNKSPVKGLFRSEEQDRTADLRVMNLVNPNCKKL